MRIENFPTLPKALKALKGLKKKDVRQKKRTKRDECKAHKKTPSAAATGCFVIVGWLKTLFGWRILQAQPVLCIGLWCFQPFESGKNAQNEMNARHTRKRPPQFADANEEGVYRSVT